VWASTASASTEASLAHSTCRKRAASCRHVLTVEVGTVAAGSGWRGAGADAPAQGRQEALSCGCAEPSVSSVRRPVSSLWAVPAGQPGSPSSCAEWELLCCCWWWWPPLLLLVSGLGAGLCCTAVQSGLWRLQRAEGGAPSRLTLSGQAALLLAGLWLGAASHAALSRTRPAAGPLLAWPLKGLSGGNARRWACWSCPCGLTGAGSALHMLRWRSWSGWCLGAVLLLPPPPPAAMRGTHNTTHHAQ
jgi:hypothetical protein